MPERDILAIILDGVGDRPHPDLDGATPLQAATTPTLDGLASGGETGQIDPLAPGIVPGSGTGHLGLFGYDPLDPGSQAPSRGCIEALGLEIEPRQGLVAARGNFVTLDDQGRIADRRAGRFKTPQDHQEAADLVEAMNGLDLDGVTVDYHPRMGYRFVVLLEQASPAVSDTDPGGTGTAPKTPEPTDDQQLSKQTASRLHQAVEQVTALLEDHRINDDRADRGAPVANGIVTRGAGPVRRGETLADRFGLETKAVAGGNAYRGIAGYMGMDLVDVEGATGDLRTDYHAKVEAALEALETSDLVYLHIKSPDICGENGDPVAKAEHLEKIDQALGPVLEAGDVVVGVTGDHSTPSIRAAHSGDPVPLILSAPTGRVDDVTRYDELSCSKGSLGRLQGGDFLASLLDLADRTKKTE